MRLDRINRVEELRDTRQVRSDTYEKVRSFMQPREGEVPSQQGAGEWEALHRGEMSVKIPGHGGRFYSSNKEFARQFTQSGQDHEIQTRYVRSSDIHSPQPEIFAGDPDAVDKAVSDAKAAGKKAVRLSEGMNQPHSVFVFDQSAVGVQPREGEGVQSQREPVKKTTNK